MTSLFVFIIYTNLMFMYVLCSQYYVTVQCMHADANWISIKIKVFGYNMDSWSAFISSNATNWRQERDLYCWTEGWCTMSGHESGRGSSGWSGAAPGTPAPTVSRSTLYGTELPFDGWVEYAEHLDSYCVANDVTDVAKKRAILLNAVGPTTYRWLRLCLLRKPNDHNLEELVEKVKTHFNPKPSPTYHQETWI